MARSARGRIHNGALPSWPPLRTRAVLNGLCLSALAVALHHLAWNVLGFTVFDAAETPMLVRVLALWFAVGLPLGCIAIGVHLIITALAATNRLLLSHGAASWDPGEDDAVLRGVRVRNWRPKTGESSGVVSVRTLGWVPVQTPWVLFPLGLGVLVSIGMGVWLATGYGRSAFIMLVTVVWLGWRMWRAWGGWVDFRADQHSTTARNTDEHNDTDQLAVITADETWDTDDLPEYQPPTTTEIRVEATRELDKQQTHTTEIITPYQPPVDEKPVPIEPQQHSKHKKSQQFDDVVLVDRSAQRAQAARQKRGRTPTMAEAEENIYGRRAEADSILGYLVRRRKKR